MSTTLKKICASSVVVSALLLGVVAQGGVDELATRSIWPKASVVEQATRSIWPKASTVEAATRSIWP